MVKQQKFITPYLSIIKKNDYRKKENTIRRKKWKFDTMAL